MTSFAQSFVLGVWSELNLSREVEKIFCTTRSHKFLHREFEQFFLSGEVGELEGFVEEGFVEIEDDLHRVVAIGKSVSEAIGLSLV